MDVRKHIRMLLAFPNKPKDIPGNPSSRVKVTVLPQGTPIEEYRYPVQVSKNINLGNRGQTRKKLALVSTVFVESGSPEQVRQVVLSECAPWLFYVATTNVGGYDRLFSPLTKAILSLRKYSPIKERFGTGIFTHYANAKFKKLSLCNAAYLDDVRKC